MISVVVNIFSHWVLCNYSLCLCVCILDGGRNTERKRAIQKGERPLERRNAKYMGEHTPQLYCVIKGLTSVLASFFWVSAFLMCAAQNVKENMEYA